MVIKSIVIYIYQPLPTGDNHNVESSLFNLFLMVAGDDDSIFQGESLVERHECGDFASAGFVVVDIVGCLYGKTSLGYIEIDLDVAVVVEQARFRTTVVVLRVVFHEPLGVVQ